MLHHIAIAEPFVEDWNCWKIGCRCDETSLKLHHKDIVKLQLAEIKGEAVKNQDESHGRFT